MPSGRDRPGPEWSPIKELPEPQSFDRVLSSMCTEPVPAARQAANRFLASNPGDPASYPAIAEVESAVLHGLGTITDCPEPDGYVATGGTEANIQAVRAAVARSDASAPNVVAPASAHFSFRKAAELMGVELRRVPTDDSRRADPDAMATAVDAETAMVIGVAGSTEYGRVDPIPALGDLATDIGAQFHVDAAWGGFLLPFADHPWNFGDAAIDTMTIDPHKTGRAPIPAGGLLARTAEPLAAVTVETPYLEAGSQQTLVGTRSGAGVAGTWAALAACWPEEYRATYERTMADATWLAERLGERGYRVVEPTLPLVAVDLPATTFEGLRERGWRIARTDAGETRIVHMPHVSRELLEAFLADLDAANGR